MSALDKSVQAQVLNLLQELKAERALTYVFISHDLNVIEYVSEPRARHVPRSRWWRPGTAEALAESPKHPYTQALFASAPTMDPDPAHGPPADHRRSAEPDRPALRLPLPHPLRLRDASVRADAAHAARDGPGPRRRLLSVRGRARDYNGGWTLIVFVATRPLTAGLSLPPSSGMSSSASATADSA